MRALVLVLAVMSLVLSGIGVGDVRAQVGRDAPPSVDSIRTAYHELEYDRARRLARSALTRFHVYERGELADVHRILALVEISEGNREEARLQFEAALSLNPDLQLDPTFVSPPILRFFERVKREWWTRRTAGRLDTSVVAYPRSDDLAGRAALRSIVLPGWGQYYRGDRVHGVAITVGWIAAAGGFVRADSDHRPEWALAGSLVWVYAYLDALLRGSDSAEQTAPAYRGRGRGIDLRAGPRSLGLRWSF